MSVEILADEQFNFSEDEDNLEIASLEHGILGSRLNRYLGAFAEDNNLGWVCDAQTSFSVKGHPPTRQPDVAFFAKEKLPTNKREKAGFAPDLAVEIISENDKIIETEQKVWQYQQSGVRLVWVVHPFSQTVSIYRLSSGLLAFNIGLDSVLDGENVLPGFKLALSQLFANL